MPFANVAPVLDLGTLHLLHDKHYSKVQKYQNRRSVYKRFIFRYIFLLMMISGPIGAAFHEPYSQLFYGIYGVAAGYLVIWLITRIDGVTISSVGIKWERKTLQRFFIGMLIALLLFGAIIAMMLGLTPLTLTYNPTFLALNNLIMFLPIFPLALGEELCFRSYPQFKLNDTYGIWISQFVIAILFGAYHVLMGWNVYVAFTGPFVWAFVFGLAAIKYGGIAASTGIHFGINLLQALLGTKGGKAGIWKLEYLPATSKAMMIKTEHVGLLAHALLLIGALALTARYISNKKQTAR